jgi:hypothetical protein
MGDTGKCAGCGAVAELERLPGFEVLGARCLACFERAALTTGARLVVDAIAEHPVGAFALTALEDWSRGRRARERGKDR